jgi:hypothetical protein
MISNDYDDPQLEAQWLIKQRNIVQGYLQSDAQVAPNFQSVTRAQFRSHVRIKCRLTISKQGPPFPSV